LHLLLRSHFVQLQIARRLLGKILIDLRNTREEAICIAGLKSRQEQSSQPSETEWDDQECWNDEFRRCSATSEKSMEQDDEDDRESQYRLDPKYSMPSFKLQ